MQAKPSVHAQDFALGYFQSFMMLFEDLHDSTFMYVDWQRFEKFRVNLGLDHNF